MAKWECSEEGRGEKEKGNGVLYHVTKMECGFLFWLIWKTVCFANSQSLCLDPLCGDCGRWWIEEGIKERLHS